MTVAGILLAAGSATRMGRNKLMLRLDGESLVRRAARAGLEAGLAPLLVVLGHEAGRAATDLEGLGCRTVLNPDHQRGINTSLAAGVSAVPPDAAAAVILLADMPWVSAVLIRAVVDRYRETGAPLVITRYGGVAAPPTLYDRSLLAELGAGGDGEGRGRELVRRHRGRAAEVEAPADALADVDLPEDFERVRERLASEETR